jgi:SpoVK/Ycf46/Vps4 family AAA+-type ATPase
MKEPMMSNERKNSLSDVYNDLFTKRSPQSNTNLKASNQMSVYDKDLQTMRDLDLLCDEIDAEIKKQGLSNITVKNQSLEPEEITKSIPPKSPSPEDVKDDIEKLIGLSNIKEDIEALMDFITVQQLRKDNGLPSSALSLHTAFIGNPGTGKTTVARLMGQYFQAIGILKKGHLIEVSRSDLVAEHVGGTAVKTNKVIDRALDGILFIDEAYSLSTGSEKDYGQEAINILVDRMEKDRDRLAVFFAGYDEEMKDFFNSNSGLASRVTRKFFFNDYSGKELLDIFKLICDKNKYILDEAATQLIQSYFDYIYFVRNHNFGNGREVRNTFENLIKCQADRIANLDSINKEMLMTLTSLDVEKALPISEIIINPDNLDGILGKLNDYVGLQNIKSHIKDLINLVKNNEKRAEMGLPVKQLTFHSIFLGSPGTGKTTVARLLGQIYHALGILKKGHLVEVDRSGLVGAYVGQTEIKTNEMIDKALDGILFIDEAYALVSDGNDYGQKAIDTLLKRMDDDRERLIVIVAGYSDEMNTFINTNPGLKDRFTRRFEFMDFTSNELYDIFVILANKQQYSLSQEATTSLRQYFDDLVLKKEKNFGNGRFVRNLFERVIMTQANRVSTLHTNLLEEITAITADDINNAINKIH